MKIVRLEVFRGPNRYASEPVIVVGVDPGAVGGWHCARRRLAADLLP